MVIRKSFHYVEADVENLKLNLLLKNMRMRFQKKKDVAYKLKKKHVEGMKLWPMLNRLPVLHPPNRLDKKDIPSRDDQNQAYNLNPNLQGVGQRMIREDHKVDHKLDHKIDGRLRLLSEIQIGFDLRSDPDPIQKSGYPEGTNPDPDSKMLGYPTPGYPRTPDPDKDSKIMDLPDKDPDTLKLPGYPIRLPNIARMLGRVALVNLRSSGGDDQGTRDLTSPRLLKRLAAQATIYIIWSERNKRLHHDGMSTTPTQLFRTLDRVFMRDTILARRQPRWSRRSAATSCRSITRHTSQREGGDIVNPSVVVRASVVGGGGGGSGGSESYVAVREDYADEEDFVKAGGSEIMFVQMQQNKDMDEKSKLATTSEYKVYQEQVLSNSANFTQVKKTLAMILNGVNMRFVLYTSHDQCYKARKRSTLQLTILCSSFSCSSFLSPFFSCSKYSSKSKTISIS
uniref:Uncharacterized protein n=1 Tax=Brassica oleracea var. oleracea TaxID=109376 RepID=A0A0D3BWY7_BRAOL